MRKWLILFICLFFFSITTNAGQLRVLSPFLSSGSSNGVIGNTDSGGAAIEIYQTREYHNEIVAVTTTGNVSYAHIKITDGNGETACVTLMSADGQTIHAYGSAVLSDNTVEWENIALNTTYNLVAGSYTIAVHCTTHTTVGYFFVDTVTSGGNTYYSDENTLPACGAGTITPEDTLDTTRSMTLIFNNTAGDPS